MSAMSEARLAICAECPFLFKPTYTCKKCGCFMQIKARIASSECPVGNWGPVTGEDEDLTLFEPLVPQPQVFGWARISRETGIVVNVEVAEPDYIASLADDPEFMFAESPDVHGNSAYIGMVYDQDRKAFI